MIEKKIKNGVELYEEGQHLRINVPSFCTVILVYQEDKRHFIECLEYIYNKYKSNKYYFKPKSIIKYGKDEIYFGNSLSIKYPKFGNYLEIDKIPIVLDLLNCYGIEYCSVGSIIKKIKKIRGGK